jgi:hypothetical protein
MIWIKEFVVSFVIFLQLTVAAAFVALISPGGQLFIYPILIVGFITGLLSSIVIASENAEKILIDEQLELLGLYCHNCKQLRKGTLFRRLSCKHEGRTEENNRCEHHSEFRKSRNTKSDLIEI